MRSGTVWKFGLHIVLYTEELLHVPVSMEACRNYIRFAFLWDFLLQSVSRCFFDMFVFVFQTNFQTYMGDVLIAVNPFTDLPIYGKWVRLLYWVHNSCKRHALHGFPICGKWVRLLQWVHNSCKCHSLHDLPIYDKWVWLPSKQQLQMPSTDLPVWDNELVRLRHLERHSCKRSVSWFFHAQLIRNCLRTKLSL